MVVVGLVVLVLGHVRLEVVEDAAAADGGRPQGCYSTDIYIFVPEFVTEHDPSHLCLKC